MLQSLNLSSHLVMTQFYLHLQYHILTLTVLICYQRKNHKFNLMKLQMKRFFHWFKMCTLLLLITHRNVSTINEPYCVEVFVSYLYTRLLFPEILNHSEGDQLYLLHQGYMQEKLLQAMFFKEYMISLLQIVQKQGT